MRTVFAISSAIALFATSAFASKNADFNPVNFVDEVATTPASLTNEFVTFRWKGEEAVAMESFDVNVENTARIQVTDFKNRGDMFEVFDNGQSLGMTTKVDALKDEEVFAATPEEALNDDRFSKGIFDLAKGEHKITIKAVGPYEAGTAAIRVLDQGNVAFHKKSGHDDDDDEDDDDDKKHGHGHHDDDDDDDDKKHGHSHKGGDDDEEGGKGGWHKDDENDDEGGKGGWHKGGDDDDEEGGKGGWHKGGDDEEEGGKGGWHKGGDDEEEGGWHKGGDDEEEGGWHKGGNKWNHKRPTDEEYDLSHTITLTKTKWVVQKPTHVGTIGIVPL
ncbi:hypothetical protein [Parasitella parasitica]|uniref:Uncharacterized protein n=1 Tax=Parasitella parasitica TaxID=35722 RepID=A0A0B7N9M9_9FUNG|nr:hypothetical protein [Parasitella parasitica]